MTKGGKKNSITRVVYKDKHHHGTQEEFFVLVNPDSLEKWRKDKTIPLVEVVESFDVFTIASGGHTGISDRPSKQMLAKYFETENTTEIIQKILQSGEVVKGDAIDGARVHGMKILNSDELS
ncbi:hypothetical protein ROZALSC1DRAFT_29269 [Rozella allomycis CSF55]|uniref:Ribosome maturation protein SDO1/SBDS N-terminal domain-containing protein n=1 Tax=Rozella allomycis (strain CSF55) TaxID=988480 RepID=A0A075AWH2_ROZAC|nr:hypothetical protein O9G_002858 [Rozella allomycis CSF55]RKP19103.1 hypothetical protein ROZALSC1DRAFT_29269 [Rozella allomycis CSF55]|eukprot:EPZ33057.1 hypothetical protein O9G_002858 [Rozella allomycis CSF55]